MSKITVTPITNGQDLTSINNNFAKIATELNSKVLYRANPVGEANTMGNTLDMNSNDVINAGTISGTGLKIGGSDITDSLNTAVASAASSAATAQVSATQADTKASQAAASAAQAASTLAGALVKTNNLSDLASVATAKINLALVKADVALGNVDNTSDVNKPVSTAQAAADALKKNILGVTDGSNASTGQIGEYITSGVQATVSMTTSVVKNVATITLTAGDWDVSGICGFGPASTTQVAALVTAITTTSATAPGVGLQVQSNIPQTGSYLSFALPPRRVSVSVSTPVYLIANAVYNTSTLTVDCQLNARRVR